MVAVRTGRAGEIGVVLTLLAVLFSVIVGYDDAQDAAWDPFLDDDD